jgi:predicted NAD/FAD-dependent oxidoreductase
MSAKIHAVLVIGGGATGSRLASQLESLGLSLSSALWEKSTNTGRISDSKPRRDGAAANSCAVDLGAQYFSSSPRTLAALAELRAAAVLSPLHASEMCGVAARHAGGEHYVAPAGASSVVRFYRARAAAAGIVIRERAQLVSLDAVRDSGDAGSPRLLWRAEDAEGGVAFARAVVLSIPAPQALALRGAGLARALAPLRASLEAVRYSTRIALALHWPLAAAPALAALAPWTVRFVDPTEPGGDVIRYLSFESRKRARGDGDGSVAAAGGVAAVLSAPPPTAAFVAHSTVAYGARHVDTPDIESAVREEMVSAALAALTGGGAGGAPPLPAHSEVRVHRWKFSQVTERAQWPAAAARAGGDEEGTPPLVLCGDYAGSDGNFSGALESADAALAEIAKLRDGGALQ